MNKQRLFNLIMVLTCTLFVSAAAMGQINTKPVVHWKFDEAKGTTTTDATGNTGVQTFVPEMDETAWVEGKIDTALYFDGTDDKMTGPYDSVYFDYEERSFTMSLWVNFASADIDRKSRVISYGTFMLAQTVLGDTGVFKLQVKNLSGSKLTLEVADDVYWNDGWTLMTFVRDAENMKVQLWANDMLVGEKDYSDSFLAWDFNDAENLVTIGASTSTDPAKFQGAKGIMDDYRIYDVALSADEIASLYDGSADVLAGYWPFDETAGATAMDKSGNANDATLNNMGDTNWIEGKLFNALEFDGIDDFGKVAYDESMEFGDGPFSISFWVKSDSTAISDATKRHMSFGSLILREVGSDIKFRADIPTKTELVVPSTKVVTNEWVLVTAIRDTTAAKLKLYANTELLGELDAPQGAFSNSGDYQDLYIGSNNDGKIADGKGQFYKGFMDEVRVFVNKALTADEILEIYSAGNTNFFDLTIEASTNGTITASPEGGTYPEGSTVTLTAAANDGYYLESWGGDASGSETVTAVTMDADKTVSATFVEGTLQFKLTVTQSGDGTGLVARSTTDEMIDQGTEVTLTAVAYEGSAFGGWTGDIESYDPTITFTMDGDVTVDASFLNDGPAYDILATYQEVEATDTLGLNYTKDDPPSPLFTNNPGYEGDGFFDFENTGDGMLEWTVKAADIEGANKYYALLRYAHGGDDDRTAKVEVNGTVVAENHSFLPTGAWSIWKKEAIEVNFTDGDNTIKYTSTNANSLVNFDQLQIARFGTGVSESQISNINTYPNPASGNVSIDYMVASNSNVQVNIVDITGRNIETIVNVEQTAGFYTVQYNVEDLKSGIYFVVVSSNNASRTVKLNVK